jgi:hypothetical protein
MDKGRTAIALLGAALVLMVGCGVAVAAPAGAPASDTPKASARSSEMPSTPQDSDGRTGGGALRVVPARLAPLPEPGGCIIGLDCGCIRGVTCVGTVPHHKPAPTGGEPQSAPPPPPP